MHAHQLLADSPDEQRRYHRGIHTAGQGQKHLLVPYLVLDLLHLLLDEFFRQGRCGNAFHVLRAFVVVHRSSSLYIPVFATIP